MKKFFDPCFVFCWGLVAFVALFGVLSLARDLKAAPASPQVIESPVDSARYTVIVGIDGKRIYSRVSGRTIAQTTRGLYFEVPYGWKGDKVQIVMVGPGTPYVIEQELN